MRPVSGDPKEIVRRGYDECGARYSALREPEAPEALTQLIALLPAPASVLDIGCGAGSPVGTTLAKSSRLTAVDISAAQVRAARAALPETATVIHGDIMKVDFPSRAFDAVVSIYTLFHLPRDEHRPLLERVAEWLKPGGVLLITTALTQHAGYTEDDFFGSRMYWSHFGPEWYEAALQDLGFRIMERGALPPGQGDEVEHPVFLARSAQC